MVKGASGCSVVEYCMNQRTSVRWAFDFSSWRPSIRQLQLALSAIQPEERSRLWKLQYRRDWLASLSGRLMMRRLLSHPASTINPPAHLKRWKHVQLTRTDRGKPYALMSANDHSEGYWLFNVSHDGRICILAADWLNCCHKVPGSAAACAIGCDVVHSRRHTASSDVVCRLFDVMRRQFSDEEWKYVNSAPLEKSPGESVGCTATRSPAEQYSTAGFAPVSTASAWYRRLCRFYRCWALKESYVKADGCGINIALRRISFTCRPDDLLPVTVERAPLQFSNTTVSVDGAADSSCSIEEYLLDEDHVVAVTRRYCSSAQRVASGQQTDRSAAIFVELSCGELLERCEPLAEADVVTASWCEQLLLRPYSALSQ